MFMPISPSIMSTITAVMIHITRISDFSVFVHSGLGIHSSRTCSRPLLSPCFAQAQHCRKSIRFCLRQPYGTCRSRKFPFGNPDQMMVAHPARPQLTLLKRGVAYVETKHRRCLPPAAEALADADTLGKRHGKYSLSRRRLAKLWDLSANGQSTGQNTGSLQLDRETHHGASTHTS